MRLYRSITVALLFMMIGCSRHSSPPGARPARLDPVDIAAASEVLRKIRPYIRYIDPALPLVQAAIKNDEAIYSDENTRARLITPAAVPVEYSRLITREWTRFRTGY
jgi:hypothetical protein